MKCKIELQRSNRIRCWRDRRYVALDDVVAIDERYAEGSMWEILFVEDGQRKIKISTSVANNPLTTTVIGNPNVRIVLVARI